jgi:hypothetical protein
MNERTAGLDSEALWRQQLKRSRAALPKAGASCPGPFRARRVWRRACPVQGKCRYHAQGLFAHSWVVAACWLIAVLRSALSIASPISNRAFQQCIQRYITPRTAIGLAAEGQVAGELCCLLHVTTRQCANRSPHRDQQPRTSRTLERASHAQRVSLVSHTHLIAAIPYSADGGARQIAPRFSGRRARPGSVFFCCLPRIPARHSGSGMYSSHRPRRVA